MILTLWGMNAVILFDLLTFGISFLCLALWIHIPELERKDRPGETLFQSAQAGLQFLRDHRGILDLILFLAAINLIASKYNAAFPALILSRSSGGEAGLGIVNATVGIASLAGSVMVSVLPARKAG